MSFKNSKAERSTITRDTVELGRKLEISTKQLLYFLSEPIKLMLI